MIEDYLHQTASLERKLIPQQNDGYGNPLFASPVTIKCRIRRKITQVQTPTGTIVSGSNVIVTTSTVEGGDRVNGKIVLLVGEYVDGAGNVIGSKVIT